MTTTDRQRELDLHRHAIIKAEAQAARDAERQERQQLLEAEAERFAREHGMMAKEPVIFESALEKWQHFGGLRDPEAASRILSDPAKRQGIQQTSYDKLASQRQSEEGFWARGGGRLPGQEGPAPQPPQRPRLSAEWLNDPEVIYDAASLALIEQATRKPGAA